ncbi:SRPBCC family protein [Intrasporangium calvum]|uniref:SRPBCC family protein n=1 Tax=Intrasporangium calvum TaxID=53358 RepID=UPI000DF5DDA7|nr:SRPBCC family protein [Intrasporangium calvum]AXG15043.1 carbon monoxide dehydrogenase [Intrasporangium calvum]
MELTHSFTVPTSVDEAWVLLTDLRRVGDCFPGATVTEVTGDEFTGTVKVKLGPISLVYGGSGSFVARDDENHRAVIEAKGKDKRGNGTAGATVTVELTPDGDGARADVVTDLAVTGKPAQFGRGVMQDVSDKLLGQFIACIEKQLGGGAPVVTEADAAPVPQATVQDAGEAAQRPEIVTDAVPDQVHDTGEPLTLPEEVARSKSAAAEAAAAAALRGPTPGARSAAPSGGESADDALDLGATVLPVLIQRYSGFAVAAVVGAVVGWLLGRRQSHR